MQSASNAYVESMAQPFRNRAYIQGSIGIINSEAQDSATANTSKSKLIYFSDKTLAFQNPTINQRYATGEENVSKTDGSMFFLPPSTAKMTYYNNGIVTNALKGTIYITFNTDLPLNIRGLTIGFGEYYPKKIKVVTDETTAEFEVTGSNLVIEDVNFDNTTYIAISATTFDNGNNKRLRIESMSFGVVETFGNDKCLSCNIKEYVSSISDSLPSKDVEIVLDNQDGYYDVEDNESALSYLEFGQEVKVKFGYDVTGNGDIEWMPETRTYLSSWTSSDTEVDFICADIFAQDNGLSYSDGGYGYASDGTFKTTDNLYDLAVAIMTKAGLTSDDYVIDDFLKETKVSGAKMPKEGVYEALQIVANAGRCVMYDGRDGKIHIHSAFVPTRTITCNGTYAISCKALDVFTLTERDDFVAMSTDHSIVGSEQYILPTDEKTALNSHNWGYVSSQISGSDGTFIENPTFTITYSTSHTTYGLTIAFNNSYATKIKLTTYKDGTKVLEETLENDSLTYSSHEALEDYDKLTIEFTETSPNSRVFIKYMSLDEIGMELPRNFVSENPTATKTDNIKEIVVNMPYYSTNSSDTDGELTKIERTFKSASAMTSYLEQLTFDSVNSVSSIGVKYNDTEKTISKNYCYSALNSCFFFWDKVVSASGLSLSYPCTLTVTIYGKSCTTSYSTYKKTLGTTGDTLEWTNPLILNTNHAKLVADWLADYYSGRTEYEIDWRGDPRTDANDVFLYTNKNGVQKTIRAYQNEISFDGGFSGVIKAREVTL